MDPLHGEYRQRQLPWELLDTWHHLRGPVLVCGAFIVVALKLGLIHLRGRSKELVAAEGLLQRSNISQDERSLGTSAKTEFTTVDKKAPRRVVGQRKLLGRPSAFNPETDKILPIVFFFSLGGVTEAAANRVREELETWSRSLDSTSRRILPPTVLDLSYIEHDEYFISPPKTDPHIHHFYLILSPSYNVDSALNNFLEHLQETHHDFRIDTAPLSSLLGYSVFGFGDTESWPTEQEGFCSQAIEIDKWMAKLTGRKRAFPVGMGDIRADWKLRLEEWKKGVQDALVELQAGNGLGEGVLGSGDAEESDVEVEIGEERQTKAKALRPRKSNSTLDDVEDLGKSYRNGIANGNSIGPLAVDFTTYGQTRQLPVADAKEMVPKSSPTYAALTKQGYTIVGSHSGVKICRWTKSALRGRGSCYKFSFYGIKSHLCMETTPSLSCSNKCVFCWRHGTNPVGTTWRWKVDPPEMIFDGVKEGHYKKIKMLKGVPGVRAERFAEAMRIRHCALSLVGEPIFYPHINAFLNLLHKEHISSFLVCNAQHPDQLAALNHVTQLYVSIDASNKESLKKIDRPLHRDFWERFLRCLDILREKRFYQRTVFRLTLVKGFNIEDEAEGYADLVARGLPCFVEVKGVTFCGTSTSSSAGLTMENVPFYEEVCDFVRALVAALEKRGLKYGIAAEHAHSCCVLLGSNRFKIDGRWHTTIGYDKFFQCLEGGKEFGPEDYIGAPTPEWALWGNGGFDPRDERHYRKGKKPAVVTAP